MALQMLLLKQLMVGEVDITTSLYKPLLLFLIIFIIPLLVLIKHVKRSKLNLPPSPTKFPIIGNLHQLGTVPHRSLQALSRKYGPLMLLHMGSFPTLVVSSAEMAREMMRTHDIAFSNRPMITAAKIFVYGGKDVAFAPYGEYWRHARKICVQELLSLKRVQSFQYVLEEEVAFLTNKIRRSSLHGGSVNISEMLRSILSNIVSRCVLGRKVEEENGRSMFGELARGVVENFSAFYFGDMFSCLGWLDVVTGKIGRSKASFRALDAYFDQVIEEHRISESDDDQSDRKDFVDILLQLQKHGKLEIEITQDNIKAILLEMFVGGTDSTSTTIEWTMVELMRNPNVMKKAQEEVRSVVKNKLNIDMSDIDQMEYLKCVIKESLRLHPSAPLLVPRETSAMIKMGGYDIPANTKVFVNAWSMQRDPELWDRPEEFYPERFVNDPVDYKGQYFQFIPFGGGRRGCPGMSFGVSTAEYVLAYLLYWFDWKLPDGTTAQNLDMTEVYGLAVHKKIPLHLLPTLYTP
ncbi:hypothetical protein ACOSQ3_025702 [Xanthoceras sorbifolium]